MQVTITRAAGKPRAAARLTAARAPWLALDALPGDSPGRPLGCSVQARSRKEEEEDEDEDEDEEEGPEEELLLLLEEEAAVPLPNSATSSAALAAAPRSPSSIARVTRYRVEAPGCAASLASVERRTCRGSW